MRLLIQISVLLSGGLLAVMSGLVTFSRRVPPQPQLAGTVISTHFRQSLSEYDIFLVHAESGLRRRIAYGDGLPDYIDWTADGRWLSYYEGRAYGTGRFLRVDWRGESSKMIASDGAWFSREGPPSPDSRWQVWIGLNRTLYLYNPMEGTDALIDAFGEHPQGIRSAQRVEWSADGRWLYVIDIWRYVGDRILGPDTNIIDLDYFVYRIDVAQETSELLVSERAAILQALDIGTQWIVYTHASLNFRTVWRVAADGSDRVPITFTAVQGFDYPLFWATQSGDVIVVESHVSGGLRRFVFKHFMVEGGGQQLLSIGGVSTFQSLQNPIWSADHQYLSFIAETINHERLLLIINEAGDLQYSAPIELCMQSAPTLQTFWQQHDLYALERDGQTCQLRKISTTSGRSTIQFDIPKDSQLITMVDDVAPPVIKIEDRRGVSLISLDGTQMIRLSGTITPNDIVTWSWLPFRSQSYRWAMIIGLVGIVVVFLDRRLQKYQLH